MDSSTLALIFFISLIVFFVLLVICTIAYFVGKAKAKTIEKKKEQKNINEEDTVKKSEKTDKETKDVASEDSSFVDSAFTDSAFVDSAFTDSAFTDCAFVDSAFAESTIIKDAPDKKEVSEKRADDFIETVKFDYKDSSNDKANAVDDYDDDDDYDDSDPITDELITPGLVVNKAEQENEQKEVKAKQEDVEAKHVETQAEQVEVQIAQEETENNKTAADADSLSDSEDISDSAFFETEQKGTITNELIEESVKEAEAMAANVMASESQPQTIFDVTSAMMQYGKKSTGKPVNTVSSSDEFYWYNKMDVAQKPSYKTAEMYYHHFERASECIEDLLIEMYDCALVRTEEIKYIAYGIEPKTISMKEIMSIENYGHTTTRVKEPTAQDLVRIYEKWCSYVDKLFDKVEIHADDATIEQIRKLLCEFGKNDVDVLIEGK